MPSHWHRNNALLNMSLTYKKSKTGKTLEMMLLPVTKFTDDDKDSIEDQVCLVLEMFSKGFSANKNLAKSAGGNAS